MFLIRKNIVSLLNLNTKQASIRSNTTKRFFNSNKIYLSKFDVDEIVDDPNSESVEKLLDGFENEIYYSDFIESKRLRFGYRKNKIIMDVQERLAKESLNKLRSLQPLPVSLKYLDASSDHKVLEEKNETAASGVENATHLPFKDYENVNFKSDEDCQPIRKPEDVADLYEIEIRQRMQNTDSSLVSRWMEDYDSYAADEIDHDDDWTINYGTPDPNSKISNVPCGGCGALLHCKDTSIPGYLPSEIFKNCGMIGAATLSATLCQRCYFLKKFNLALQVRVSPEDYPNILTTIKNKRALVILMVDLLDFPCSLWPGMPDLFHENQPFVVVGNKVDLLPQDSRGYLTRVTDVLQENLKLFGFALKNIQHIGLTSAKTGYGVEELVTKLFNTWHYKGDVFLVGTTNVGKSSLFNALLQSDYCKVQAGDLIQRATTSPWPGTTLNLLKFPIMRPKGWSMYARTQRLISEKKIIAEETKLRKSLIKTGGDPKYATLMGHINRTFSVNDTNANENADPFSLNFRRGDRGKTQKGIDEKADNYIMNKWCYDTPGVVHPDQITNLLTTEELIDTLPKELIRPRTFSLKPQTTLFIGGLARMDLVDGPISTRITVFCSNNLPVTICSLEKADEIYDRLLGTQFFLVPSGGSERLKIWPNLQSKKEFKVRGIDHETSCADIVLSSAGWISITPPGNRECVIKAWTPEARGIHLREPILPNAVSLRGKRIRYSPAYAKNRFFIQ